MLRETVPFKDTDVVLSPHSSKRILYAEENAATSHLRKVQTSAPIDCIIIETSSVIGNGAKIIVDFTEKHNLGLISISDDRHWLPGSLGEKVVRDTLCSRLVFRRQKGPGRRTCTDGDV